MRKAVLIISIFLLCTIVSAEDYRREAQISFTAGLVANVGFTASPVSKDNYIKPAELSGENSVFEFSGSTNNYNVLSTDSFYIYWQIFSPYKLKIYESQVNKICKTNKLIYINKKSIYNNLALAEKEIC